MCMYVCVSSLMIQPASHIVGNRAELIKIILHKTLMPNTFKIQTLMLRLCSAAADIEWLSGVLAECGRASGWWVGGSDNVAAEVSKTLNKRQCQHCQTENLTKHFPAWFVNLQSPTTGRQDDRTKRLSAVLPGQKQKEIELS